jgi:hypothetical protein
MSDTTSIDTTTTLTVDPDSEITVIDQELLSTLSENVARPAQSVTPVAWNDTPDRRTVDDCICGKETQRLIVLKNYFCGRLLGCASVWH